MESCRSSNRLLWTLTRSCIREPKHPGVNATTHCSFIFGVVHHGGEPTGMLMKTRSISAAEMNFFRGFKKYWREERNVRGEKRFYARIETGSRCCQSWWAHSERATALGKRILREHVFIVLSITLFCWSEETPQKGKDSGPCQRTCISTPSQWTPGSLCISPPSVWSLRDSTCERPPRPASGNTNVFVRGILFRRLTAESCPARSRREQNKNLQDQFQEKRLQLPSRSSPKTSHQVCVFLCITHTSTSGGGCSAFIKSSYIFPSVPSSSSP